MSASDPESAVSIIYCRKSVSSDRSRFFVRSVYISSNRFLTSIGLGTIRQENSNHNDKETH